MLHERLEGNMQKNARKKTSTNKHKKEQKPQFSCILVKIDRKINIHLVKLTNTLCKTICTLKYTLQNLPHSRAFVHWPINGEKYPKYVVGTKNMVQNAKFLAFHCSETRFAGKSVEETRRKTPPPAQQTVLRLEGPHPQLQRLRRALQLRHPDRHRRPQTPPLPRTTKSLPPPDALVSQAYHCSETVSTPRGFDKRGQVPPREVSQ